MSEETHDAKHSHLLLELSRDVTANLDLQEVLDTSLKALRCLVDFGGGAIQLIDGDALIAAATDPPATPEAMTVRIPVGQGVSGTIASTGEPCYIADITVDPRVHPEGRAKGVSGGVRAYFGVPLILHGQPIGVVQLDSPRVDAFDEPTRSLVLSFVPTIAAAVQNAQLFEREVLMTTNLRELQRLRADFLIVVSHELRTPLTTISGMAQALSSQVRDLDPDIVTTFANRIVTNSRRLELLIDDLLDLSQLEQGSLKVTCEATNLATVIGDGLQDVDLDPHPVECQIEPDLPMVHTDERRAHQILSNLLSNAAKYSPPNAPIGVTVRRAGTNVLLEVTDQGDGVPADLRDRIFEPFFQIEPAATRGVGGLGVGLHLVRELCDAMGATVTLDTASGHGSCFCVSFPMAGTRGTGGS
ncbi:MAG: GAF domain-containing sensor histidine kinase [Microthrixaceae bacterium]